MFCCFMLYNPAIVIMNRFGNFFLKKVHFSKIVANNLLMTHFKLKKKKCNKYMTV